MNRLTESEEGERKPQGVCAKVLGQEDVSRFQASEVDRKQSGGEAGGASGVRPVLHPSSGGVLGSELTTEPVQEGGV